MWVKGGSGSIWKPAPGTSVKWCGHAGSWVTSVEERVQNCSAVPIWPDKAADSYCCHDCHMLKYVKCMACCQDSSTSWKSLSLWRGHTLHISFTTFSETKEEKEASCQTALIFSMHHMHVRGTEHKDMWQSRQIETRRIESRRFNI